MPPILALFLCASLVRWLIRRDVQFRGKMSAPLWIPLIWLLIYGSRPIAAWLPAFSGGGTEVDGNKLDATVLLGLIIAACVVLKRRGVPYLSLTSSNLPLFLILLYFGLSISWASYPFVALKRWSKEVGHIFVMMVILTDGNPAKALRTVCFRCATLLFPLSVVLIKYYPVYGRSFTTGGVPMMTGVTTQKNSLGEICCIFGLAVIWDMVEWWKDETLPQGRWKPVFSDLSLLGFSIWLLILCDSKTSLMGLLVGTAIIFATKIPFIRIFERLFAKLAFAAVVAGLLIAAFWTFAVAPLLENLGRDATFTERTQIWTAVLKQDINSIVGCGFFSFWLEKGPSVWESFDRFKPHSAHDGYLETYLDGGVIGVVLLVAFLCFSCLRCANLYSHSSAASRWLFATTMVALILNFSEAYFFRLSPSWSLLVIACIATYWPMFQSIESGGSEKTLLYEWDAAAEPLASAASRGVAAEAPLEAEGQMPGR